MTNVKGKTMPSTFKLNHIFNVEIQHYFPEQDAQHIAILLPAIGITIDKYQKFIHQLNQANIAIITADYPGYGKNLPKVDRQHSYGYADLIEQFIPALVNNASQFPTFNTPTFIGHSLGAHIATLYAQHHPCHVVGIATGNVFYKHWQGKARYKMLATAYTFCLLVNTLGYLPGDKIGFGKREAKGLINDFASTVIRGNYHHILPVYDKSNAANLFLHIQDDQWAPMTSMTALADLYHYPHVEQIKLTPDIKGNPHSVWLKAPEIAVSKISQFLTNINA
ncbi:alpha/beta fold hydrolase [Acinetobacter puyangensis]|nr:alpha/beta fold hydrolase [Acinetobacter puyangensis]